MPKIIINTTPWMSLSILNLTSTLPEVFDEVIMPGGVKEEVLYPDIQKVGIEDLHNADWLKFYQIKNKMIYRFNQDLDKGELEVIIAAKELKINNVLIDEKLGRLFAKHMSLNVMGTLGYLLLLKKRKKILKIKPLITLLQKNNIWISESIKKIILSAARETK